MKSQLSVMFFLSLFFSSHLWAKLPVYQSPLLLARANITDGYNLPPMTFLSNTSPVINNRGDVAFKMMSIGGDNHQGIWLKNAENPDGAIIYNAPNERLLTDPSLNDEGSLTFSQYDDGVTDGVFSYDGLSHQVFQSLNPENKNIAFYTYPQLTLSKHIYFRGTSEDNVRTFYQFDKTLTAVMKEGDLALGLKTSYLFKPSVNDSGEMSFKRRIGEQGEWDESAGDEIVLLTQKGSKIDFKSIARDKDLDLDSPFLSLYNSTSLSKNGSVAFVASLLDSKKALLLWKEGELFTLAKEGDSGISEIELFAPKVNQQGMVAYRAKNDKGLRSVYVADQSGVQKLLSEGDEILTDQGPGKILSNPNYPGIGGEIDMNDRGEIVFYCLITGLKDNKELGSAVYVLSPVEQIPLNFMNQP